MSKAVTISIIVPCFNQGEYLSDCLNSIIDQSFTNWECIVVDDGSTDNTSDIAKAFEKKDDRIKYSIKTNGGLSSARNFGISLSKGEFILPLDADDYISKNYLQCSYDEINKSNDNKVVFGVVQNFGANNERYVNVNDFIFENQLLFNQIHCSGLYRKLDALEIKGYDEQLKNGFEDWEFYIRLLGSGGNAIQLNNITLFYRRKNNSMFSDLMQNGKKFRESNYIIAKSIKFYNDFKIDIMDALVVKYKLQSPESFFSYREIFRVLFKKIKRTFSMLISKVYS